MPLNHKSGMQFQKIFSNILETSIAVNIYQPTNCLNVHTTSYEAFCEIHNTTSLQKQ